MGFFERWIIKNVKSPVGDFRDREAIAAWAGTIAAALQPEGVAETPLEVA